MLIAFTQMYNKHDTQSLKLRNKSSKLQKVWKNFADTRESLIAQSIYELIFWRVQCSNDWYDWSNNMLSTTT